MALPTVPANVMSLLPSTCSPLTRNEFHVADPSSPISSLFPLLMEDAEQLSKACICVTQGAKVLDVAMPLSSVLPEPGQPASPLTFVLKPRLEVEGRVKDAEAEDLTHHHLQQQQQQQRQLPRGFVSRANKHQDKLTALFADLKWREDIVLKCPAVGQDPFIYDLLRDRAMFVCLARDKKNLEKLLPRHPCLYQAIEHINQCLLDAIRNAVSSTENALTEFNFSLDQYNTPSAAGTDADDDDMGASSSTSSVDDDHAASMRSRRQIRATRLISRLQTRARGLPNPSGMSSSASASSNSVATSTNTRQPPTQLDLTMLRYAMAQAYEGLSNLIETHTPPQRTVAAPSGQPPATAAATSTTEVEPMEVDASQPSSANQSMTVASSVPPSDAQTPQQRWAAELTVLAEMGITDREVAALTLDATGGNIDMALQLLFG